jgi:hypothetical protein
VNKVNILVDCKFLIKRKEPVWMDIYTQYFDEYYCCYSGVEKNISLEDCNNCANCLGRK